MPKADARKRVLRTSGASGYVSVRRRVVIVAMRNAVVGAVFFCAVLPVVLQRTVCTLLVQRTGTVPTLVVCAVQEACSGASSWSCTQSSGNLSSLD
eukprot:3436941-Rhodomonas_salina.1